MSKVSLVALLAVQQAALSLVEENTVVTPAFMEQVKSKAKASLFASEQALWPESDEEVALFDKLCEQLVAYKWDLSYVQYATTAADSVPAESGSAFSNVVEGLKSHPEQKKVIVLSTRHLSERAIELLFVLSKRGSLVLDRSYGFFVFLSDYLFKADILQGEMVPFELLNIVRQVELSGFNMIMFADDGEISPVLPVLS